MQEKLDPVQEMLRIRSSFAYFLERFVYISDAQKLERIKWHSWDCHQQLAEALDQHQLIIVLKARQLGITWLLAARALWLAIAFRGGRIAVFSQGEREAAAVITRVKFIYKNLPPFMQIPVGKDNETEITFPAFDSAVIAYPATGNAGRSESATLVIYDEWASHPEPEQQFAAVKPLIDAGGKFVGVSTGQGAGTFYHAKWLGATRHENNFFPLFFPWNARPDRNVNWYERMQREYKKADLNQEYPSKPDDAFRQMGQPYFDEDYLNLRALITRPKNFEDLPDALKLDPKGFIYQYARPGRRYCIGVDVAEGGINDDSDFSCITVLDWESNEEVAFFHGRWTPARNGEIVDALARHYPSLVGIERNSVGMAVVGKCEQLGTPGLYRETQPLLKQGEPRTYGKHGWHTNGSTKPVMLTELEEALRHGYHRVATQMFLDEARVYQDLGAGKSAAPKGFKDDCVLSRAIALQMRKHASQFPGRGERVLHRRRALSIA